MLLADRLLHEIDGRCGFRGEFLDALTRRLRERAGYDRTPSNTRTSMGPGSATDSSIRTRTPVT